jgi:hypothetical protein
MHLLQTVYFRFRLYCKTANQLIEENQAFQWTPEVETAFHILKEACCNAPILAYQQPRERFVIDTEEGSVGIGGVLSKIQDGQERVIAYYSKTLNKAERIYCITQRELLPIVRTLEYINNYLYGQVFHMRTDHSELTWLRSFKNLETDRPIDSAPPLHEYQFTSIHGQSRNQQFRCPFAMTMLRRGYPLPQSRGAGRRHAGASYCGCSRSRLGSNRSENITTEQPGHRTYSGESRDQTASKKYIHPRPQPLIQMILGLIKIPRCEERHTRAPLIIHRWMIRNYPENSPSKQSERCAE